MRLPAKTRRFRERVCETYLQQCRGILHLGANLGQEAERYSKFAKPVLWVEALPDIHLRLEQNIAHFPGQRALCAVLGDADGRAVTFNVSSKPGSSSLFQFGRYASGTESLWPKLDLRMVDRISLTMITLDTLLKNNGIDPAGYDYWVVDLQGAEKLAVEGASRALRDCRSICIEISKLPVYENGVLWPELRSLLEGAGFQAAWEPGLDHDNVLFTRAVPAG
jgi:FkbM family methyltransferase